jgi:hypothetical protein
VEGLKRRGDVSSMWRVGLGPEKVRESCLAPQCVWQNESSINVNSECRLSDSTLGQQIVLGRTVQPCPPKYTPSTTPLLGLIDPIIHHAVQNIPMTSYGRRIVDDTGGHEY